MFFDPENVNAILGFVFVTAIPVSLGLGVLFRWRYRRGVTAAMLVRSDAPESAFSPPDASRPNPQNLQWLHTPLKVANALRWPIGLRHFAAGCVFSAIATAVVFYLGGLEFFPIRTLVVFAVFAFLAALIAMAAAGVRWWVQVLIALAWVTILDTVAEDGATLFGIWVALPVVALLALGNRWTRTTAVPLYLVAILLVAPLLLALDLTVILIDYVTADIVLVSLGPGATLLLLIGVSLCLMLAAGLLLARLVIPMVGRVLAGSSEFMMLADTVLLIETFYMIMFFWSDYGAGSLLFLLAFAGYRLCLALLRPKGRADAPILLLLRVFGQRGGQAALARTVLRDWRQNGPVILIGADDLATETLDAHELAAFATGRMGDLFIDTPEDLAHALDESTRPVADGLYPVLDFYCRDNSWRPTIQTLMSRASEVILDLRGFGADNAGVRYEIEELAARVPTDACRILYNSTTDQALAKDFFAQAWSRHGRPDRDAETLKFVMVR